MSLKIAKFGNNVAFICIGTGVDYILSNKTKFKKQFKK